LLPTAPDRPANRTIEDGPIRRLRSRLLLIYRRSYGTRLMLRMLVIFWGVMSAAGLITEGIFDVAGLIPTTRPTQVAPAHFSWNYTTYLNIVFLVLFAALYWAYRNRDRLGGGAGYALDPVCGMQVETANAPASGVLRDQPGTLRRQVRPTRRWSSPPGRATSPPRPVGPAGIGRSVVTRRSRPTRSPGSSR
jgi:hypothetical protein